MSKWIQISFIVVGLCLVLSTGVIAGTQFNIPSCWVLSSSGTSIDANCDGIVDSAAYANLVNSSTYYTQSQVNTLLNAKLDVTVFNAENSSIWIAINNKVDTSTFLANNVSTWSALNSRYLKSEVYNKTEIDILVSAFNVNVSTANARIALLNSTKLDITDQRYNDSTKITEVNNSLTTQTGRIDLLNSTKLDITDQRYNDTAYVIANYYNKTAVDALILNIATLTNYYNKSEIDSQQLVQNNSLGTQTGRIDLLNSTKLDATDQRYNESDLISTEQSQRISNDSSLQSQINNLSSNGSSNLGLINALNSSKYDKAGGLISGDVTISGNLNVIGSYANLTVTNSILNGTFNPSLNNTFDVGSSAKLWNEGYFDTLYGKINYSYVQNVPDFALNSRVDNLNQSLQSEINLSLSRDNQLNGTINALVSSNTSANSRIDSVNSTVTQLVTDNTTTKSRIDSLNTTSVALVSSNTTTNSRIDSVNTTTVALVSSNTTTNSRIDTLNSSKLVDVTSANSYIAVSGTLNKSLTFSETVLNSTIATALATTYYNVTNITVITGTGSGTLAMINSYDSISYNISEALSDMDVNLTINNNLTSFNQLIIRYKTIVGETHSVALYLWDYGSSSWESYDVLTNTDGVYVIRAISVFDSSEHVSNNSVKMRLYTNNIGAATNLWNFDWVSASKGVASQVGTELDPLSIHKTGDVPLTANWAANYNITGTQLLDALDQRYNDTTLINNVNTTANIGLLGYNTTTQLDSRYGELATDNIWTGYNNFNPTTNNTFNGLSLFYGDAYYYGTVVFTNTSTMNVSSGVQIKNLANQTIGRWGDTLGNANFYTQGWINSTGLIYENGTSLNTKYNDTALINTINNLSITQINGSIGNFSALGATNTYVNSIVVNVTALNSTKVNTAGDTMTGGLTIDYNALTGRALNIDSVANNTEWTAMIANTENGASTLYTALASSGGDGRALYSYRNLNSSYTNQPVAYINQDNSLDDQNALNIQQDGTGTGLLVDGAGTNYSALFNNGNVGIGTLTPSSPLQVNGTTNITGQLYTGNIVHITNAQGLRVSDLTTTGNMFVDSSIVNFRNPATSYSSQMYINNSKIGINTTTPDSALDVHGDVNITGTITSPTINTLNSTKANIGNCAVGQVVQNTTSTGVQCVTVASTTDGTGGWTNTTTQTSTTLKVVVNSSVTWSANPTCTEFTIGSTIMGVCG